MNNHGSRHGMKVIASRVPVYMGDGIEVRIYDIKSGTAAVGLTMQDIKQGEMVPTAFTLNNTEAQCLMDQLWDCGHRPTEGSGSAGSLAATERHLQDMRRIVAKKLGIVT